ncbi:MAG: 2,3-bisphosphoglycerate-dependent phosphoglycerate mutase [Candidatus Falkowbacteria bacterium]|nr:2,3-bisphosphoglycerate-dependent phosphoglycerate mutase [Candidatus Falkowbacteria bacterium]
MIKIVLIRHGQTTFNKKNLFCGWTDADLTPRGRKEALKAGQTLKRKGFKFDLAFDSFLKRSSKTLALILKEMPGLRPKIIKDWRLNERHYGDLQGKSKPESVAKFGAKKVLAWRRGYAVRPPQISKSNKFNQSGELKYRGIKVPLAESLKDVEKRTKACWQELVVPALKQKKKIIISASGNNLRALIKYLDKLSAAEIAEINIPTGIPMVYELDNNLKPIKHYYLASRKELAAAISEVKNQTKR